MAKTRSARGGRKNRKAPKAKRAARAAAGRPVRKAAKKAVRRVKRAAKKAVRQVKRTAKTAARRLSPARKKPAKKKPAKKKAARKTAAVTKKAGRKAPAPKTSKRRPGPHQKAATRAAQAAARRLPALNRERRRLAESDEELMPSAPSTLGYEGGSSAARTGRSEMREARIQHTETGPVLTGGDVDASWEDAYAVGDEAPGGDNPTPDQDRVDDIGKALGLQYADNEELKGAEKIIERDRHRWELDPASSDDYRDRSKDED
jgi:hypothetical protein